MAKIMLVDDHKVVRTGLKMVLEGAGHEVVAEAGDGLEAVSAASCNDYDLIIMDYSMPHLTGLEASKKIREVKPDSKILILTMYDQTEYIKKAMETKVDGFILKSSKHNELLDAISLICDNGKYFDQKAMGKLFDAFNGDLMKELSDRETAILKLAAEGLTNKEIAGKLGLGEYTVRDHLRSVYEKLNVSDRAQAVATAIRTKRIS